MRMKPVYLLCAVVVATFGCSDGNKAVPPVPVGSSTDAPADQGAAPTPPTGMTLVRVVHLVPDAPPIDVCIAAHGSTAFRGPLLKQAGVGAAGVAYAQATNYLALPPAQYDVRVIDGGAASCARGLFDATDLPATRAGEKVTIAALGLLQPPAGNDNTLELRAYADNSGAASGPTMALRFIHASPDTPTVEAGVGSGNQFSAMFARVAYADVGVSAAANDNGYVTISVPQHAPLLTVRLQGGADDALTFTPPTEPSRGDTLTSFLIGDLGGAPAPLRALVCLDNAAPQGALADCAVRP